MAINLTTRKFGDRNEGGHREIKVERDLTSPFFRPTNARKQQINDVNKGENSIEGEACSNVGETKSDSGFPTANSSASSCSSAIAFSSVPMCAPFSPSSTSNSASSTHPSSLAFMRFKDDMIEALKRLKQLEKREKELEEKLKVATSSIGKSEAEKQTMRELMEKKEDEANEKAREIERSYIRIAEEEKIRLRKMVVELNAALKRKDAHLSELESVKLSLQESTVRSADAESKLKDATRLQEFQAKRNEALLASNENLKSAAEVFRKNERRNQGKTEAMAKLIIGLKEELETATEKTKAMERAVGVGNSRLLSTEVELRKARGMLDENAAKERRLAEWRIEEAESFKAEIAKWKRAGQEKDSQTEDMQKRLDSLYETIKTQIETNSKLEKCSEDARSARVQMEKDLRDARGILKAAEEEARRRGDELNRIQREAADAAKAAENRITDLEREIEKGNEAAATAAEYEERNTAYIEALKTSLDANEKVGIRVEEKYRAEAQEWKDKEACYEAQLREMQEMRERLDQLTTVDSNHHHPVLSAFRKGNSDTGRETDTDFSVLRNQARLSDKSASMEEVDHSEVVIGDSSDELFETP